MRPMMLGVAALWCAASVEASGTPIPTSVWDGPAAVDPASVPMPDIAFVPTEADRADFDKYFFFHRSDTDFATAYADLDECDNYAAGRPTGPQMDMSYLLAMQNQAMAQYGAAAGAAGGLIGGMIVGAIVDAQMAAQRRKLRRGIMRHCMAFKGYSAFGLSKAKWTTFNFEEGWSAEAEDSRMHYLRLQAKVASGPRPSVGELR